MSTFLVTAHLFLQLQIWLHPVLMSRLAYVYLPRHFTSSNGWRIAWLCTQTYGREEPEKQRGFTTERPLQPFTLENEPGLCFGLDWKLREGRQASRLNITMWGYSTRPLFFKANFAVCTKTLEAFFFYKLQIAQKISSETSTVQSDNSPVSSSR